MLPKTYDTVANLGAASVDPRVISQLAFSVLNCIQDSKRGEQIMTIAVMRHILCEKQKINPSDLERYVRNLLSAHDEDNKPVLEIKALEGYMEDELQE